MDGRDPIGDLAAEDNVFNHIMIGTPKGILDLNTAKYLGEEHLAQIAEEQAKVDAELAPAQAPLAPAKQNGDDKESSKPTRGSTAR
jgi:hypothetical protein